MSEPNRTPERRPATLAERFEIDRICTSFDLAWRTTPEDPPRIESFLLQVDEHLSAHLLRELMRVEVEYRRQHGADCLVDDYVAKFPQFEADVRQAFSPDSSGETTQVEGNLTAEFAVAQAHEIFELLKQFETASGEDVGSGFSDLANRHEKFLRSLRNTVQALSKKTDDRSLAVPKQLGDFQIIRQIGRGGMGAVFEAEQLSLKRRVALKVLWFAASNDLEAIQRFQREATTVANLHHTNIVPIFAVGNEGGIDYYAMQLIDGDSLDKIIRSADYHSDPYRTIDWGLQAAEALAHSHERGIVHRDVKPSNLILDKLGRIWLSDFGLAKSCNDQSLSIAGAMLGTPRYMSPEQASMATRVVDHRSDIYSLGATLYELLAGRPVFEGDSPLKVIQQILLSDPIPLEKVNREVPRDLATVVMKCLSKEPGDRYESARDLAGDLRSLSEGRPIRARRSNFVDVAGKWLKRKKVAIRNGIFAAASVVAILAIVSTTWLQYQEYQSANVELKSTNGPVVATFLEEQGRQVTSPITLPTQTPLKIQSGDYTLRTVAPGYPSIDYSVHLEPSDNQSFTLNPEEQRIPIKPTGQQAYRFLSGRPNSTIVSWDDESLNFSRQVDLETDGQWKLPLKELSESPGIHHVVGVDRDLDDDNEDEILFTSKEDSALRLVSRSRGVVWIQVFPRSMNTIQESDGRGLMTPIRGQILQKPIIVPDQNGDGYDDVLVCVGQNFEQESDPSQVLRFVSLVSTADGHELWRHEFSMSDFQLPDGCSVAEPLQWLLGQPYSTGQSDSSNSVVRHGRLIRQNNRKLFRTGNHCEAPQAAVFQRGNDSEVVVRTGTKITVLDLGSGEALGESIDTGIVSCVPFQCEDLDGDQIAELIFVQDLRPAVVGPVVTVGNTAANAKLTVWSVTQKKPLWNRTLEAKPPTSDLLSGRLSWPVTAGGYLLVPSEVSHNVGFVGESLPWSSVEMIRADNGDTVWKQRIPNCESFTDRLAFGPDINGDLIDDVFIGSMWGNPLRVVVECRSGKSGELLWLTEQEVVPNTVDEIGAIQFLPESMLVHVVLQAPYKKKSSFSFEVANGRFRQSIDEFDSMAIVDIDGDGAKDTCLVSGSDKVGNVQQELKVFRGQSGERWRYLGHPANAASDFDNDGIQDLIVASETAILAIAASDRRTLWQYPLPVKMTETTIFTWESTSADGGAHLIDRGISTRVDSRDSQELVCWGRARRSAWDIDKDGVLDIVVQGSSSWGVSYDPVFVLSGRTGKLLWKSGITRFHQSKMAPLQFFDLQRNGSLQLLCVGEFSVPNLDTNGQGKSETLAAKIFTVGMMEADWTIPLGSKSRGILDLDQMYSLLRWPRSLVIDANSDSIADLVLLNEMDISDGGGGIGLTAIDGRDGKSVWTIPLDIHQYDDFTFANCDRAVAADLNVDGRDEILTLRMEDQVADSGVKQRIAVLQATDVRDGRTLWTWQRVVHDSFLGSSMSRIVRPHVLKSKIGSPRLALNLRTQENVDNVFVVDHRGQSVGEIALANKNSYFYDGFPCWVGDCNSDGQDELLCDDNGLTAYGVFDDLRPVTRFPVMASDIDMSVAVISVDSNTTEVRASPAGECWVKAFDATTGKLQWSCHGPNSEQKYRAGQRTVQVLDDFTHIHPLVVFNGFCDVTVCVLPVSPIEVNRSSEAEPSAKVTEPLFAATPSHFKAVNDPRYLRPLPWSESPNALNGFGLPPNFIFVMAFSLISSLLLLVLPGFIAFLAWKRKISHIGALMVLAIVVAVAWPFFATNYQIPIVNQAPSTFEKIALGIQFAPMWLVLWSVPSWLLQGRMIKLFSWLLITFTLSALIASFAIADSITSAPLIDGERFAWTWSSEILVYGMMFSSWLLLGVTVAVSVFRCFMWSGFAGQFRKRDQQQRLLGEVSVSVRTRSQQYATRWLYFGGILIWILSIVLVPQWKGVSYHADWLEPQQRYTANGAFGLDGGGFLERAPLWSPPHAYSGLIQAKVRWPLQSPFDDNHVEIAIGSTLILFLNGTIMLGLLVGVACALIPIERRDPVWLFVWSITLSMILIWMVAIVLNAVTMGALPTDLLMVVLLLAGFMVGGLGGKFVSKRNLNTAIAGVSNAEKTDGHNAIETSGSEKITATFPQGIWLFHSALFVVGMGLGVIANYFLAIFIVDTLDRSPRMIGLYTIPFWVQATAGLIVMIMGGIVAIPLFRIRKLRGLSVGFGIGSLVVAVLCLIFK